MLVNGARGNLISIRDRGLLYGDGIFRTFPAINGQAQHWPLHYQKLQHDCAALVLTCPDEITLLDELKPLLVAHPDGVFKIIVTRGIGQRGYAPPCPADFTHIWDVTPRPIYTKDYASTGIRARVCQLRLAAQPLLAGIKHLNRLENVLAAAEKTDDECAEGLLLDANDCVIEGIRSNVFLVQQGALVTPDLSRCGVAGVQRARIMAWAQQHNIALQVREVKLAELKLADEVFFTNSVISIWPLRALENRCWHDFPMTQKIRLALMGEAP